MQIRDASTQPMLQIAVKSGALWIPHTHAKAMLLDLQVCVSAWRSCRSARSGGSVKKARIIINTHDDYYSLCSSVIPAELRVCWPLSTWCGRAHSIVLRIPLMHLALALLLDNIFWYLTRAIAVLDFPRVLTSLFPPISKNYNFSENAVLFR